MNFLIACEKWDCLSAIALKWDCPVQCWTLSPLKFTRYNMVSTFSEQYFYRYCLPPRHLILSTELFCLWSPCAVLHFFSFYTFSESFCLLHFDSTHFLFILNSNPKLDISIESSSWWSHGSSHGQVIGHLPLPLTILENSTLLMQFPSVSSWGQPCNIDV